MLVAFIIIADVVQSQRRLWRRATGRTRSALERVTRPQPAKPTASNGEPFRIQYLGGAAGEGPDILAEAVVTAPDVFTAFRLADRKDWPPGASGFRLLDERGRDVFWRQKPNADRHKIVAEAARQPA